jgi:hypothetical protein
MRRWLALFALGCHDDKGSDDSAGAIGDADADADTDADTDTDGDLPYVKSAAAACALHTTGTQYWMWSLNATADDPQGTKTLDPVGSVGVVRIADAKPAATYAIACTREGACATAFMEQDEQILCDDPTQWRFVFTVLDEDANPSEPFEVTGRLAGD